MRKRQSVRDGVWYMGGRRKRRRQTGVMFPIEALVIEIIRGCYHKTLFGGKRPWRQRRYVYRQGIVKMKSYTATCDITQRTIFFSKI